MPAEIPLLIRLNGIGGDMGVREPAPAHRIRSFNLFSPFL